MKYDSFEQYASVHWASSLDFWDSALHRSSRTMSESSKKRAIKIQMRKDAELAERRSELRKEYVSKLASWEISEKTRTELLVDTARCEIEDEQVLAAMRVLDRRGIAWKR